jgi:hypothetical protein
MSPFCRRLSFGSGANGGCEHCRTLQLCRQWTDKLDAFHRDDLTDLLDGELDFAPGDELGVEATPSCSFDLAFICSVFGG